MRALSAVAALLLGWIGGRWPVLEDEVADAVARVRARDVVEALIPDKLVARLPAQAVASVTTVPPPVIDVRYPVQAYTGDNAIAPVKVRRARPRDGAVPVETGWTLPPQARNRVAEAKAPHATPRAFLLATAAYSALGSGDRRRAAQGFADAVAADPSHPRAFAWLAERRRLMRRWSGSSYSFVRAPGSGNPGTTPVLGGGQSSAGLAWTPRPLARRPLALTARVTSGNDPNQSNAEAALGVRWRPLPALTLSVERLVALAPGGRNAWTARVAGGAEVHRNRVEASAYGEAGVVGITRPTIYASVQARAGYRMATIRGLELVPGAGIWASVQHDRNTLDRLDVGPSLVLHWRRSKLPLDVAVDYRWRAIGNAEPGSGVAVTLSTGF